VDFTWTCCLLDLLFDLYLTTSLLVNVFAGQMIPPGLHVRLNLATGDKEAKLLDEDGTSHSSEQQPEGIFN